MKILRYVLAILLILILIVTVAGFLIYRNFTQGPLPQHDGTIEVSGLNDTVEILRDAWGVPHIYASNTYDLFFGQGFTQAQDRWWQMEFYRHTGSGTIQELTGKTESLLGTDIYLRTMGFRNVAQRELEETYTEDEVNLLQAFADGVNAYITDRSNGDLAFEYNILGLTGVNIEIAPWTPVDSLVWAKIMSLQLSGNSGEERQRSRMLTTLSENMVNDFYPEWPFGEKPTILRLEDMNLAETSLTSRSTSHERGLIANYGDFSGNFTDQNLTAVGLPVGEGIGSNNWVVNGEMTETGAPLMANDMHLGIQMPSIWYEVGLHCQPVSEVCPYDVVGFALSPTPGIIAGHNANIAWALTNVGPDTQDLYQIKINPDNDLQYEWNGEWRDIEIREETLHFGDGAEAITFTVRLTHLGPIINDNQLDDDNNIEGFNNDDPLALRWTALDPGSIFRAILRVNIATNWDEFRASVAYWDTPSQNLIYADTEGNIGYQTPGHIPIRAGNHSGLQPIPGWTDEYEWQGYIPFDLLPQTYNPARNFVATANQAIVPLEYYESLTTALVENYDFSENINPLISQGWAWGYRGDRIESLLSDLAPHSIESYMRIHGDNYNGHAAEVIPYLEAIPLNGEIAVARDWLLEWDYDMDMTSPHAALYASFWRHLVRQIFNDQLDEDDEVGGGERWPVVLLLEDPENEWWDNSSTSAIEQRDGILQNAFEAAYAEITEALGADRSEWEWGKLHTTTFVSNPLGASGISLLEGLVNRGPVNTGGDGAAINATGWDASDDTYEVQSGPSERVIYDLSNWENSVSIHTTGQSGHPFAENYDTMIDSWRNIEYRPMLWSRNQVEASAGDTLRLLPSR